MRTIERTSIQGVHVLTPRRNLAGGEETTELVEAVSAIAAAEPSPHVVLDLAKISWASSLGIESLLRARRACLERGGWMRVAGVDRRIHNTIVVMRFERFFDVRDTVEAAIAAPDATASA